VQRSPEAPKLAPGDVARVRSLIALQFTKEEKRQLNADRAYRDTRLAKYRGRGRERAREEPPGDAVKARRIDTIGVVYLWPKLG
jgi:hypothetical protein